MYQEGDPTLVSIRFHNVCDVSVRRLLEAMPSPECVVRRLVFFGYEVQWLLYYLNRIAL